MTPVTDLKSGIRAFIHCNSVHFCRCKDATITLHLISPRTGWFAAEREAVGKGIWISMGGACLYPSWVRQTWKKEVVKGEAHQSMLLLHLQAGAACSRRKKEQPNSWNEFTVWTEVQHPQMRSLCIRNNCGQSSASRYLPGAHLGHFFGHLR